jgi:hypothetical protein
MALSQAKFISVADKLFAKAKAGNLTKSAIFSLPGAYNALADTIGTPQTKTVDVIIETFSSREIDGQLIQANDKKLLARNNEFTTFTPRTDGTSVSINGSSLVIVGAELDPAEAVWTIQVRGTIAAPVAGA